MGKLAVASQHDSPDFGQAAVVAVVVVTVVVVVVGGAVVVPATQTPLTHDDAPYAQRPA